VLPQRFAGGVLAHQRERVVTGRDSASIAHGLSRWGSTLFSRPEIADARKKI
jgi:hypothetical protein